MGADCIDYLNATKTNAETPPPTPAERLDGPTSPAPVEKPNQIKERRSSVAGGSLFSIHNNVIEAGADYFLKIPRATSVAVKNAVPQPTKSIAMVVTANGPNDTNDTNGINIETTEQLADSVNMVNGSLSQSPDGPAGPDVIDVPTVATVNLVNEDAAVVSPVAMILNNFDPFRRLPNIPFAIKGRKRRNSMFELYNPSLDSILEE